LPFPHVRRAEQTSPVSGTQTPLEHFSVLGSQQSLFVAGPHVWKSSGHVIAALEFVDFFVLIVNEDAIVAIPIMTRAPMVRIVAIAPRLFLMNEIIVT
jgi:hypothetical protein